jgi:hypothetical protein
MASRIFKHFSGSRSVSPGFCSMTIICLTCATTLAPMAAAAQAQDPTGIKRAFLDRYLDCAEAPGDAARLACYDALLADIPAWLDDPNAPPKSAVAARDEGSTTRSDQKDCSSD